MSSVPGCKQPLQMGNDSKSAKYGFLWREAEGFTHEKIHELVKKDKKG